MKKSLPKKISKYLYFYFWDVDVEKLNSQNIRILLPIVY